MLLRARRQGGSRPVRGRLPAVFLRKVSAVLSRMGWGNGLLYLAGRALGKASAGRVRLIRYYFVAQPVPEKPQSSCRPSAKQVVRLAESDDPIKAQFPRPAHVIEHRFRTGSSCFVAQSGDAFQGFLWLARGAYEEDEVRCRYELTQPQHCVWDYDVHVEPAFRSGRTFARLWDAANAYLAPGGIRWSLSRISAFNPASLAAHARLGVRPLHSGTFLCAGRFQLAILSTRPFVHLSFSEHSRPVIRLEPPGRLLD